MSKIEKEMREEIARLRERVAVLEARTQYQPTPVIVNPIYPQPQIYPVITYGTGDPNPWDHKVTC